MEHIVTSKLRSKPEWFNWGLQKSSLNSAPIHVSALFASAAPERIIQTPGSGLQRGRNNITVKAFITERQILYPKCQNQVSW